MKNVTGSASRPPADFGWSRRKKPVSSRALTDSAGTTRPSSASWARCLSDGEQFGDSGDNGLRSSVCLLVGPGMIGRCLI